MGILKATAAVAVMLYVFYDSLIPAPLLVPVWLIYIRDWQIDLSRKKEHELRLQFRDSIQVMASALKAGYSVENAIREAGRDLSPVYPEEARIRKEFRRMVRQMDMNMPEGTDTIHISRNLNLNQVAGVCNINIDQLRALNPEFKKDIIPGNEEPYALRLPNNMISCFIEHEDSIYNYKPEVYQTRRSTVEVKDPAGTSTGKAVYYRIKNGDTLGGIAAKYGVSVNQLRRLNGIKGSSIRAGKSIRIR